MAKYIEHSKLADVERVLLQLVEYANHLNDDELDKTLDMLDDATAKILLKKRRMFG